MLKSPVIKAGRQLFRNACMHWEFVQNPCHTWTNIMSMNLIMPSIMKQCWPPLHFFQRRSNCLLCKGARRDEWWLKQMDSYLRHLRGRPSLCALLYLSVHQEHEQCGACRGRGGGGDESLCFVFSYPVTRSAQAPVFFLARIRSDCCMQTAVAPVSTYMQSAARPAVLQWGGGDKERGRQFIIRDARCPHPPFVFQAHSWILDKLNKKYWYL